MIMEARADLDYPIVLEPLSDDDGGGWLATVPDLPGCMSDGETREEAARNVQGAVLSWIEAAEELGRQVPVPGSARGEWRQRVPKSLHEKLKRLAEAEGVSLNALVTSVLAERVGRAGRGTKAPRSGEAG
jgi:antitoxin HicB